MKVEINVTFQNGCSKFYNSMFHWKKSVLIFVVTDYKLCVYIHDNSAVWFFSGINAHPSLKSFVSLLMTQLPSVQEFFHRYRCQ